VLDTELAGYPACRISGRSKSGYRIPVSGLKKKECSVIKSLRYCQFLEDTALFMNKYLENAVMSGSAWLCESGSH